MVSYSNRQFGAQRQQNIGARAKLDEAHALATFNRFAHTLGKNDAAGKYAGNLLEDNGAAFPLHGDGILLVFFGAGGIHGVDEFAGLVLDVLDPSRHRRAINVHVKHIQEDADSFSLLAPDLAGANVGHLAIRW